MLLRFTLGAAGALVLASAASAQQTANASPITTKVQNAGTYHLATGTWTNNTTSTALVGPEALYDNTCSVGFYWGVPPGAVMHDSARLP
ncbi:MAG: hypothetical protein ACI8X5_001125, partial [Planctomycetota bacterium]